MVSLEGQPGHSEDAAKVCHTEGSPPPDRPRLMCDLERSDPLRGVTWTVLVSGDGARVVNDACRRASLIRELRGSEQKG